ncbi:MAG: A24 family peptidase, partial [Ruminococcus sp.]|nr:A24 family peptidase [Ruminococcus sp.]
ILYICSYNDMQHRKIDDISILILLVLCFIYSICSSDIVLSIIRFLSVSIIMLILISLNLIHMGGGDIKLLCAIVPLLNIPEYLLMLFISSITAIIGYGVVTMVKKPKRYTIPFALYISIGAYCSKLISIFSVEHILP